MIRLLLAALVLIPPQPAAHVASWLVARPDIADDLLTICWRESRCKRIGVHEGDAHLCGWHAQVRLGHLRPWCQPHDAGGEAEWTTMGPWGLSAASNWPYAPPCYQPGWFAVPLFSAWVAAQRYLDRCEGGNADKWCPR